MGAAEIIRIDASAGSGKTYQLSMRYLRLAQEIFNTCDGPGGMFPSACRREEEGKIKPDSISAILAITFTNKAASEMKERILLILKNIILKNIIPEDFKVSPEVAKRILFHIIGNFSDFNVMTIDAFMNNILKAFAIEAGRLPDYELRFNTEDIYSLALDRLMERDEVRGPLLGFLDHLLITERDKGFNPESMIRQALTKLKEQRLQPEALEQDPAFHFDDRARWEEVRAKASAFYKELLHVQEKDDCFRRGSVKPEAHLMALEQKAFPAWIKDGRSLESLLKKNRECPALSSLSEQLEEIRRVLSDYFTDLEVYKFRRVLEVFRLTREEEARIFRELNQFEGARLPDEVAELLSGEKAIGVPAAFCRLGERYAHHLIDEFQDTSRNQWKGMTPLIENSLSEGGTFFYVGDMKQAIYGWRGGDYALMDEAFTLMSDAWADRRKPEILEMNRRSCENLVAFYNLIFRPEDFSSALSPPVGDPSWLEELKSVYRNSHQTPKPDVKGGYIEARFFKDVDGLPDSLQPVREAFFETLKKVRKVYPDREILILARKNEEIETLAGWLFQSPETVPFVTEQSLKLFALSPVKSILNLLSSLALPGRHPYLHAAVRDGLLKSLPAETVMEILAGFKGDEPFGHYLRDRFPEVDERWLAPLRERAARLSPYELTREIVARFEIPRKYPESMPLIDRLLEQILIQEQKGVDDLAKMLEVFYESTEETHLTLPETPDALRLMTIHKAKGLEADVVILPFLNWPVNPRNHSEVFRVASKRYAYLSGILRGYNPQAKEREREMDKKYFIESFNLLYVALTRAREALFCLVPPVKRGLDVGTLFRRLSEFHGFLGPEDETFQKGILKRCDPQRAAEGKGYGEKPKPEGQGRASIPADAVRSHVRVMTEAEDDQWMDVHARRLGNIAHAALATVRLLSSEASPEEVARLALKRAVYQMGLVLDEGERALLQRLLASAFRGLRDFFTQVDDVWTEKELISRKGKITRIDRLVRKGGSYVIIEFKTGRREESHKAQVRRYLQALKAIGVSAPAYGILYYLETGERLHV